MPAWIGLLLFAFLSGPAQAGEADKLDEILNYYQITDQVGTAGQPSADQFAEIAKANYAAVINLAMPDSSNAVAEEGDIVRSLGMQYIHIPVPWDAPTLDHLKQFFAAMDGLGDQRVLVHCAANYRASAFVHQYLVLRKGVSSDLATSPILSKWRPEMDENWKPILASTAKDLGID